MKRITFAGSLTIADVMQYKPRLEQALDGCAEQKAIGLDLAAVENFDGAGLQLLLSFWHAAAENGCDVVLHHAPEAVMAVLEEYDVADRFKIAPATAIAQKEFL